MPFTPIKVETVWKYLKAHCLNWTVQQQPSSHMLDSFHFFIPRKGAENRLHIEWTAFCVMYTQLRNSTNSISCWYTILKMYSEHMDIEYKGFPMIQHLSDRKLLENWFLSLPVKLQFFQVAGGKLSLSITPWIAFPVCYRQDQTARVPRREVTHLPRPSLQAKAHSLISII